MKCPACQKEMLGLNGPPVCPNCARKRVAESGSDAPPCCASSRDNAACGANPPKSARQIIAEAQRERLNHGLRTLASWCASRAMLEHDTETTLTMLEKKAAELRGKVVKAGWAAIEEHSLHNATVEGPADNATPQHQKGN